MLVGLNDSTAAIYELSSGIKLHNFEREKDCDFFAVAFSADETMVIIGGSNNKAIVYDIALPGSQPLPLSSKKVEDLQHQY